MSNDPRFSILFVSHEDTLTGAPILLLNLLDCLEKSPEIRFRIIVKNKRGKLFEEFKKRGETLFLNDFSSEKGFKTFWLKLPLVRFPLRKWRQAKIQKWIKSSNIIFLNTITQGDFIKTFHFRPDQKIISYIHELEFASGIFTQSGNLKIQIERTDRFLSPCRAVGDFLIQKHGVSPDHYLGILPYYIPSENLEISTKAEPIPGIFRVGLMGSLDWRKGADLIPVLLSTFFDAYPDLPVHFIWKGVHPDSLFLTQIQLELRKLGLENKIQFEVQSKDTASFFSNIDIFLSLSREDPYPLVVLEAARYKIPTLCFEKSGGAPEFVEEDAGSTVPFLNLIKISEQIFGYFHNENIKKEKGERAYFKWEEKHGSKIEIEKTFLSFMEIL